MKRNIVRLIVLLTIGLGLPACSRDLESPTQSSTSSPEPSRTAHLALETPLPYSPIKSPTHPRTYTPLPTNTYTPTSTFTPTATFTITPTPTKAFNIPGFYPVGRCSSGQAPDLEYPLELDFCILSVTIRDDGHMIFEVSWTVHFWDTPTATKLSDADNHNMYLNDNLGNRYDHINTGGSAAMDVILVNGETTTGWFEFDPAQEGATSFTFYDDDNGISIFGMSFFDPYFPDVLELLWYPLSMEYSKDLWAPGVSEEGGSQLTHLTIPTCQLIEWEPSEPQGTSMNIMELGGITYEIYWYPEDDWSLREYVAVEGIEGLDPGITPIFHALIPYEDSMQCIYKISDVLATLQLSDQ